VILKHIERPIKLNSVLFEIQTKVDVDYFINKIELKLKEKNLHSQTNVKANMTDWHVFNDDVKLNNVIRDCLNEISKNYKLIPLYIEHSWGIKKDLGDETITHNHRGSEYSGVLYLSDKSPDLIFPEININVSPQRSSLLLFSAFLDHVSPKSKFNESKYAIAFNLAKQP
tara:strand:- start:643 stop:1152 length:510 start_codon:yes stop_codon:yes gene_type:complete